MTLKKLLLAGFVLMLPAAIGGQGRGVDPAQLLKPLADSWPTYSGDYTGRRYCALTQINRLTVKQLTLAWVSTVTPGPGGAGGRGGRGGRGNIITGGEGTGDFAAGGGGEIKGTPLMVDGTLYVSTPDNAWAIDARRP
jgi:alcohol dehydrogenase (cytochrome c)